MKKVMYISLIALVSLFFTGCDAGYVSTQPNYSEEVQPASPGNDYFWVRGEWVFDRRNHQYVQRHGHWEKSERGRRYESGHWQSTAKGYQWKRGHYRQNDRK